MNDTMHLREVARGMQRLWLIPLVLAMVGVTFGYTMPSRMAPVYRSEATVLVGPTDETVTASSSVSASKELANFYADLARRQIVLQPVVDRLNLDASWSTLRNEVSSVVPKENLRLVTLTVMNGDQGRATAIADAVARQLVSLNPTSTGDNSSRSFLDEQKRKLRATIEAGQTDVESLEAQAEAETELEVQQRLRREALLTQSRVAEWQRAYVELVSADPIPDAGSLRVLDEAAPTTDMRRSGALKLAAVGGLVGGGAGVVFAWLLYRRRRTGTLELSDLSGSADTASPPQVHDLVLDGRALGDPRTRGPARHTRSAAGYLPRNSTSELRRPSSNRGAWRSG